MWREAWHRYCDTQPSGIRDPVRLDSGFVEAFLAVREVVITAYGSADTSRPQLAPGPPQALRVLGGSFVNGGGDNHEHLVAQVRAQQKASKETRQLWHQYCDQSGDGVRDPSRHDEVFLLAFLQHVGSGTSSQSRVDPNQAMGHGQFERQGGPHCFEDLVGCIKAAQKSSADVKEQWHQYCDMMGSGVRDPGAHDSSFLQDFIVHYGVPAIPAGQGGFAASWPPQHLIEQVKALQKSSDENMEQWRTYCDQEGDGVRDPARHDQQFLEGFIVLTRGATSAGRASVAGDLVHEVKRMQKSSPNAKQAWHQWCDSKGDRVRDPARHEAAFLEQFLASLANMRLTPAGRPPDGPHPAQPAAKRHRGAQAVIIGAAV